MHFPRSAATRLLVLLFTIPVPSAFADEAPTLHDIADAVARTRAQIHDLTVDFTFNATQPPANPGFLFFRFHAIVTVKGEMIAIHSEYNAAPENNPKRFIRETAWNGRRNTSYMNSTNIGGVTAKKSSEATTQGLGFFDTMLLNPPRPQVGYQDQNLLSALNSPNALLRKNREDVNGHSCCVIDVLGPTGVSELVLWLDPKAEYLPLRQLYLTRNRVVIMEFIVEQSAQVAGHWFPILAHKIVYNGPNQIDSILTLEVKDAKTPNPAITLNTGVKDPYFDLWTRLPQGTPVFDMDTKKPLAENQ